jgi:hypothetical protein
MLYQHLDTASAGFVPTDDCMALLRAPLSTRRAACVRHAYAALLHQAQQQQQQHEQQQRGEASTTVLLHAQDLLSRYNSNKHPEVVAGRATSQQVYSELAERFSGGTETVVSLAEFEAFYSDLGAAIGAQLLELDKQQH